MKTPCGIFDDVQALGGNATITISHSFCNWEKTKQQTQFKYFAFVHLFTFMNLSIGQFHLYAKI